MSARAERIRALLQRYGQTVIVNGSRSIRMVVFLATGSLLRTLYGEESEGLIPPVWAGVASAEEELQGGDGVVWEGVSYTVRRVVTLKVGEAAVAKMAVWSLQSSPSMQGGSSDGAGYRDSG